MDAETLTDIKKLDAVVRQLGIEDSFEEPADAVAKLQEQIKDLRERIDRAVAVEREACAAMVAAGVVWTPEPDTTTLCYIAETCAKLARDIRARSKTP